MTDTTPTLGKQVADRLGAGSIVLVVKDPDELLALAEVRQAAQAIAPVKVMSGAADDLMDVLATWSTATGTLILCDYLSVYGQNPVATRMVRQVALQTREDGSPFSRLILIETPSAEVPPQLQSDVDVLETPLPSISDLVSELDAFLEEQPDLAPEGNGEARYAISMAGTGIARHEFAHLLARSTIENGKLDAAWIRREKASRIADKLGGALTFENSDGADVGGLAALQRWLATRFNAFASKAARKFGLPEPKGVLIVGVPGAGKSLTAKMVARKFGLPLMRLDVGALFGSLVGQSEAACRAAIDAIKACAPVVLWIDELEKGVGRTGTGSDGGTSDRVTGTLLTFLQENTLPVFVVATVNRVESLPPELLRKGRFDEIFAVGLPTESEREEIAAIHLARRERDLGDGAPLAIAQTTAGFVGAEIEQAVIDGMFNAFAQERELVLQDVLRAAKNTTPLSKTASEDIKRIEQWARGRARSASDVAPVATTPPTGAPRRMRPEIN